ncbi:hypothetical protein HG537_0A01140 [Torulaspora globosa]|uniref:Uncharacterized protein n=1 Tax=Torulaspora globosa TaxID=48254 RepID=A0A7H9HM88_9SACH|nr:hypothetical protein HG537_0A01140 [Torulaspora sp. CBS 2947]
MEITRERTIQAAEGSPTILTVDIDDSVLLDDLKRCPNLAAVSHCMKTCLEDVLTILTTRLPVCKNTIVDLSLSRLEYPIHFWDEVLFLAAQDVQFPYMVYITEQGTADRVQYVANNRSLQKFMSRIKSTENTDLDGDCENLLKQTIMTITRQYGFDEQTIELLLRETHNLEELIHYCKIHRSRDP